MVFDNYTLAIAGVLVIGLSSSLMALKNMSSDLASNKIRVLVIIIVACFSTVLALVDNTKISSAFGILGAIAGYAFGISATQGRAGKNQNDG
ncbi:MAG: hypothetical protein EKK71_15250 [Candidatus Competibacteraceae bacterium]|nr:MAG: hypothetical protein EKK71_15250 [Candidatus Competibacteraceae bacterium]